MKKVLFVILLLAVTIIESKAGSFLSFRSGCVSCGTTPSDPPINMLDMISNTVGGLN